MSEGRKQLENCMYSISKLQNCSDAELDNYYLELKEAANALDDAVDFMENDRNPV